MRCKFVIVMPNWAKVQQSDGQSDEYKGTKVESQNVKNPGISFSAMYILGPQQSVYM